MIDGEFNTPSRITEMESKPPTARFIHPRQVTLPPSSSSAAAAAADNVQNTNLIATIDDMITKTDKQQDGDHDGSNPDNTNPLEDTRRSIVSLDDFHPFLSTNEELAGHLPVATEQTTNENPAVLSSSQDEKEMRLTTLPRDHSSDRMGLPTGRLITDTIPPFTSTSPVAKSPLTLQFENMSSSYENPALPPAVLVTTLLLPAFVGERTIHVASMHGAKVRVRPSSVILLYPSCMVFWSLSFIYFVFHFVIAWYDSYDRIAR